MLAVLYLLLGTWFLWVVTGIFREEACPEKRKVLIILGSHDGSVEFLLRSLYRCPGINRTCYRFQVQDDSPDRTGRIIDTYRRYRENITLTAPGSGVGPPVDSHGRWQTVRDCSQTVYDLRGFSNKQLINLALAGKLC
ncbi:hypothetical protein DCCM_4691 [Desulfocucumis palustris]|uniref:Uncharacterized protein n=1 Tax=Desulfocucumis palustris TaxID=1898651 RepID=A0A2L2XHF6_9FIRM|nr:hypothetical protein [Desulfocucumis palustris]GBF35562.1 hypothetical protein DCCM_4691 [Desulfocucumis palustris]